MTTPIDPLNLPFDLRAFMADHAACVANVERMVLSVLPPAPPLPPLLGDYTPPPRESLTCFTCPHNAPCDFAWDDYNTDGDCLAAK